MTLTPGMGGIFQFLTELVAQTTVQHGPLGHDLPFRITSNTLQALLWYTIPSPVTFTSSLAATATPLPPPTPLLNHFHRFRPVIRGCLPNSS